jgi:hypothetical protein
METREPRVSTGVWRAVKVLGLAFVAWMWFYGFVLAPRESMNNIGDAQWGARAETLCATAKTARSALADLSRINVNDPAALRKKADVVDAATDTIEDAVDQISRDIPSTDKGRALVPEWISDYRTYIRDRRDYADTLRAGSIVEFSESIEEGVPISERLAKFARENEMRSCQPPRDLQA